MFAIKFFCSTIGCSIFHQGIPPIISPLDHVDRGICAAKNNTGFNGGRFFQGFVHRGLERQFFSSSPAPIGCNLHFCRGIIISIGDGFAGKATKNHRMNRPHAGTREHGDRKFWDHGHVDGNDISRLNPSFAKHIGKLANLLMQFRIT